MISLKSLIGNTPLLHLEKNIFAKAEFLNLGGSIKDRPILYILEKMMADKKLFPGDVIIEATSGNTGIALAMISSHLKLHCKIIMPKNMSEERKKLIKSYGVELIEVPDGEFDLAIKLRDTLCRHHGWKTTNQFHSKLNIEAHHHTGLEILSDLSKLSLKPKAFVAGTGTGGTLMGVGRKLKESFPDCKIIAVEPAESPVMSGGQPGIHGIQGIGDGSKFLVDLNFLDQIILVSTEEAKMESLKLSREKGLSVGFSAAANFLAAKKVDESLSGEDGVVVTILCDRGERYLSLLP